jgi:hypothetical protein
MVILLAIIPQVLLYHMVKNNPDIGDKKLTVFRHSIYVLVNGYSLIL